MTSRLRSESTGAAHYPTPARREFPPGRPRLRLKRPPSAELPLGRPATRLQTFSVRSVILPDCQALALFRRHRAKKIGPSLPRTPMSVTSAKAILFVLLAADAAIFCAVWARDAARTARHGRREALAERVSFVRRLHHRFFRHARNWLVRDNHVALPSAQSGRGRSDPRHAQHRPCLADRGPGLDLYQHRQS